jgi:hypothetical protein
MRKYTIAVAVAVVLGISIGMPAQQQRTCLHDRASETSEQAARRTAAVNYVRQVNTAEARHRQPYAGLASLDAVPTPPEGFASQLSTDGTTYTFSVKDTTDACRFAYFSDQVGLIYTGAPLQ